MQRFAVLLSMMLALVGATWPAASAAEVSAAPCQARAQTMEAVETWLVGQQQPLPLVRFLLDLLVLAQADDCVRLSQVQVIGTHNSYHRQPSEALLSVLTVIAPAAQAWEYTHLPLQEQLAGQGIRQIELDVAADPDGGRYWLRLGPLLSGESVVGPLELLAPGMKVLHVPHVDFETTCLTLVACLQSLRGWSAAHPDHLPVMVLVEAKDSPGSGSGPVPFGAAELDALDAEIRSVFDAARLFTPDDLVARGYLVRTRADTDTEEARSGDTTRANAALASGAQFVSTDFPEPSDRPGFSDYSVGLPGGVIARCNPVNVAAGCRDSGLARD